MRRRAARLLHRRGVHLLCRRTLEPGIRPVPYLQPDGTLWVPDLNGMPSVREVHR